MKTKQRPLDRFPRPVTQLDNVRKLADQREEKGLAALVARAHATYAAEHRKR